MIWFDIQADFALIVVGFSRLTSTKHLFCNEHLFPHEAVQELGLLLTGRLVDERFAGVTGCKVMIR